MAKLDLVTALKQSVATTEDSEAPPVAEPVTTADVATEQPAPAAKKRAPARRTRTEPRRNTPKTQEAQEAVSKGVAVELPVELDARLSAYRATTRKSHPTILLEAVERTYEQLPELIRTALGTDEDQPGVVLFDRGPRRPAPIPVDTGEKVRHTIRIAEPHRELLDELTDRFEAPSRNFLIVTAYDAFLPKSG